MPFALYMLALAVFVMGTSEFMLAGLLPDIATDLDVTVGTAGLLTSAFAIGMLISAPVMAAFSRLWPARRTLLTCLFAFAVCHIVGAVTTSFPVLTVTRVLSAFANAGFLAVALSAATALVPADRTGRAVAILLSGSTIATVVGVPAGAVLGAELGWRSTFWAVSLLCIPAVIGVIRSTGSRATAGFSRGPLPDLRAELATLASPPLLLTMTLGALINAGTFAAFTFLAPVVTHTAGLGDGWVPVALALFGLGSFLGVTVAGRIADARPSLVLLVGGPLLLAGWGLTAVAAPIPVVLLLLVFVQGFLSFGVGSTLITRVLHAASSAPTMGGSYATAALNVGAAVGPFLGAVAFNLSAAPPSPVWVAAILTLIALLVLAVFRRDLPARP